MNALLTLIVVLLAALTAFSVIFGIKVRSFYRQLMAFVSSPDDGKSLSPLGELLKVFSAMLADNLAITFKAKFMGDVSGQVRGTDTTKPDLFAGLPIPVTKGLRGNGLLPVLVQALMSKIADSSVSGNNHANASSGSSPKFSL